MNLRRIHKFFYEQIPGMKTGRHPLGSCCVYFTQYDIIWVFLTTVGLFKNKYGVKSDRRVLPYIQETGVGGNELFVHISAENNAEIFGKMCKVDRQSAKQKDKEERRQRQQKGRNDTNHTTISRSLLALGLTP